MEVAMSLEFEDVRRYEVGDDGCGISPDGPWVMASDYDMLLAAFREMGAASRRASMEVLSMKQKLEDVEATARHFGSTVQQQLASVLVTLRDNEETDEAIEMLEILTGEREGES